MTNRQTEIPSHEGKAHPCTLISTKKSDAFGQLLLCKISLSLDLFEGKKGENDKSQRDGYACNLKRRF